MAVRVSVVCFPAAGDGAKSQRWPDVGCLHCGAGRTVALVSPELHGRNRDAAWGEWRRAYRNLRREGQGELMMICTDHPREAKAYFDAKD